MSRGKARTRHLDDALFVLRLRVVDLGELSPNNRKASRKFRVIFRGIRKQVLLVFELK